MSETNFPLCQVTEKPSGVDEATKQHYAYRLAVDEGDTDAQAEALKKLRDHGMSEKQIERLKKDVAQPSAQRVFSRINADVQVKLFGEMSPTEQETYFPRASEKVQVELLQKMSGEEQKKFLPMASKKAHQEFHEHSAPVHPTGYYAPRTPQEALALGPGSKFMNPNDKLRMVLSTSSEGHLPAFFASRSAMDRRRL